MATFDGKYPMSTSTIILIVITIMLVLGVGIHMIFFESSDEVQTVQKEGA